MGSKREISFGGILSPALSFKKEREKTGAARSLSQWQWGRSEGKRLPGPPLNLQPLPVSRK